MAFISLRNSSEFKAVYEARISRAYKFLIMYILENGRDFNRLGISVSSRVGNSVVRHRLTRLIREAYRLNEDRFNSGLDIVVVARAFAGSRALPSNPQPIKLPETEAVMLRLAHMHGIILEESPK